MEKKKVEKKRKVFILRNKKLKEEIEEGSKEDLHKVHQMFKLEK
jgi:hypothetical protein